MNIPIYCKLAYRNLVMSKMGMALSDLLFRREYVHQGELVSAGGPRLKEARAALVYGLYESAEIRCVKRWLEETEVVELGGSIGVVSMAILRAVGKQRTLVTVEPDPELSLIAQRNLERNGYSSQVIFVNGAVVGNDSAPNVKFSRGTSSTVGRVADGCLSGNDYISVRGISLNKLIKDYLEGKRFALVCDIEGEEWNIFSSPANLEGCYLIIIEVHPSVVHGTFDDFSDRISGFGFMLRHRDGNVGVYTR